MGVMLNGAYHVDDPAPDSAADGEYRRAASTIRNWITADGATGFAPDAGRYHLYVAWNCPWAHRTLLARGFLGLDDKISVSFARPRRDDQGWIYDADGPFGDGELGVRALHQVYARQPAPYTGRVTVPVLWDRETQSIVSNESADIVRMLGQAFAPGAGLYPADLADDIDTWNTRIHSQINNGVYRAGFARSQSAYDSAVHALFDALDVVEAQLAQSRYLTGDRFTEADLRLFPTLARFDVAYHTAFKCNRARIVDYPNLWGFAREVYQMPGVAETVDFDIYRAGYYSPSPHRNPLGIVAIGPRPDWHAPHGRG